MNSDSCCRPGDGYLEKKPVDNGLKRLMDLADPCTTSGESDFSGMTPPKENDPQVSSNSR